MTRRDWLWTFVLYLPVILLIVAILQGWLPGPMGE